MLVYPPAFNSLRHLRVRAAFHLESGPFFIPNAARTARPFPSATHIATYPTHQPQRAQAIAAIEAAARSGHAEARFRHAIWQLIGDPIPRDLPGARATLRALAGSGHAEAQLIDVALTANGSGGPADWDHALALLRAAANDNVGAQTQLDLVDGMALTREGAPSRRFEPEWLSADGSVQRLCGFLSPVE